MKVYVGKVVSTHGIKGEIRILSDFLYKDKVFIPHMKILIGEKEYVISSYRHHKNFEMITLEGYSNINDVLFLLKKDVYVEEDALNLSDDEILDEELITYQVLTNNGKKGIIKEIFYASPTNKILRVFFEKEVLIPFQKPFIVEVDKKNKIVLVELIEGM